MLAEHFEDPPAYIRSLHYLLDFYSDRARRSGQSGKPGPLITAYNVKPPVLRQIILELTPLALENPQQGLALCDALWEQPYLELRLIAATLVGQIPPDSAEAITQRIQTWMTPELENYLMDALLMQSMVRLRQERSQSLVRLFQDWIESPNPLYNQLGLRALLPWIRDPEFENLPVFFRLIQQLTRNAPTSLRPDLLDVLEALARRSPKETAYFLRQTLNTPEATDTPWIIRQTLHSFPAELQQSLRSSVKSLDRSKQKKPQ